MCVVSCRSRRGRTWAFTLVEVMLCLVITITVFSGIIVSYVQAGRRVEWSGRSLAAEALAIQIIEQARSGTWDEALGSEKGDDMMKLNVLGVSTNYAAGTLTGYTWQILDLPSAGTNNQVRATNWISIKTIAVGPGSTNSAAKVRRIRVDTVWPFRWNNRTRLFTNTIMTYCAPDNRDPSTLFN